MIYGALFAAFALSAQAFSPSRAPRVIARASSLSMTSTLNPTTAALATAARDARGLAIDSISAVRIFLFILLF
jgi:hypothetical protein